MCCQCNYKSNIRTDCIHYHCEHDMGANIDCCTLKGLGNCPCTKDCSDYVDKAEVYRLGLEVLKQTKAANRIKQLPIAHPTYTDNEIQKMQDLESAEIEKAYQIGYEEGKKNAQPEQQWIPVTESLPEEDINVLVCNENGNIEITSCSYSTEVKGFIIWYTSGWKFGKVIAWMPLPEPYKAERREESEVPQNA